MKIGTKFLAIVLVPLLIGTVAINQVYAPRGCGGGVQFKKLTHDFEKAVIGANNPPEPDTPA